MITNDNLRLFVTLEHGLKQVRILGVRESGGLAVMGNCPTVFPPGIKRNKCPKRDTSAFYGCGRVRRWTAKTAFTKDPCTNRS